MAPERRSSVDSSTFKIFKEVTDDKIDALFSAVEKINTKLDVLLIDIAKGQALAIIGKWCLILIPAIATLFGAIAVWRN